MNLHIVLIAATMLAAAFIFSIGLHILAKSGIVRKKYFLLLINSIFIILLGHMIELTAGGTDSAFSGVRLLYFGGALTSMFLVFFIADYFGIKLHAAVRAFLVVLAAVYILAAWTTDKTGFLYASMEYDPVYTHYLLYAPGPLGLASRAAPMFYAAVSTVLLLRSLRGMRGKRRAVPVIMLAVVFLPCASEIIFYALSVLGYARISLYLTPHILTGVVFLMYYGIIRYDIDAEAVAAVVAMDTISEPFILLDGNFCCLSFNKAAGAFFPWITALPGDEPVLSHPGWPRELPASVFSGGNRSVNFSSADGLRLFSAGVNPANTVSARRVG
ncbi:MAG: hypothetical protein LBK23_01020, partial [Oscillospiraceae bacterium]|nr:hypothetical protein [Oscillospiraceae bacterium]